MDPGALVLAAQTGLDPLRERFGVINTSKARFELVDPSQAAAADRYVVAVMAWADKAQRALAAQPNHTYAEQLRITYDDHVGEAVELAKLGYGGQTALSAFTQTLQSEVGGRAKLGAGIVVVLLLLLLLK